MVAITAEHTVRLRVGEITIAAVAGAGCPPFAIQPTHQGFLVENGEADATLRVHYRPIPSMPRGDRVFDSGGLWTLNRDHDKFLLRLASPFSAKLPRLLVLDDDFRIGDLYIQPDPQNSTVSPGIHPFQYPMEELLLINLLAQREEGVIIHACGVADGASGLLLAGVSGAGKSTIAEIWKKTDATLLSDDRIIIRRQNDRWRMYGTPWHGDADIVSPEHAPLARIYFLEQAAKNYAKPLSPMEAASRLLVRCFPPFYDRRGMEFILEFLSQVAAEVPCFELGFVRDDRIIDFVRGL